MADLMYLEQGFRTEEAEVTLRNKFLGNLLAENFG